MLVAVRCFDSPANIERSERRDAPRHGVWCEQYQPLNARQSTVSRGVCCKFGALGPEGRMVELMGLVISYEFWLSCQLFPHWLPQLR